jgi:uncharacterized spore protein YtfJ
MQIHTKEEIMENVDRLVKTSMGEIERLLSTKSVVGEPMSVEGNTIIPLVSISFGFGAGGGSEAAKKADKGEGGGEGTAGGGHIKPTAVVVISKDGVYVAAVGGAANVIEMVGEMVGEVIGKAIDKRSKK